jgi:hypothetical protein
MARIELLKQWRHCTPGFVMTDVRDGLAELLVARKIGRVVIDSAVVAQASVDTQKQNQNKPRKGQ